MIDLKEAKEISIKTELADVEQLAVIERFIYDKKGVSVGILARPRGEIHLHLMHIAFEVAAAYYGKIE